MQGLGLGIGLEILAYKVSDSESGLESRDSGNSAVDLQNTNILSPHSDKSCKTCFYFSQVLHPTQLDPRDPIRRLFRDSEREWWKAEKIDR